MNWKELCARAKDEERLADNDPTLLKADSFRIKFRDFDKIRAVIEAAKYIPAVCAPGSLIPIPQWLLLQASLKSLGVEALNGKAE